VIVTLTAEAKADLEQIATYVAEQSPGSALKLVRELRQRCESLLHAPRGYPLCLATSNWAYAGVCSETS
jgi:plasmid stabilization system protein ParE